MRLRLFQPASAICTMGQLPSACSIGASERPSRIEPAIIAPAVISFCSTRYAPMPSIADCKKSRKVFVSVVKKPVRSDVATPVVRASSRNACQRVLTADCIPMPITDSASLRMSAAKEEACAEAIELSACRLRVRDWLSNVIIIKNAPPDKATQPNIGWKTNINAANRGVNGMSNIENSTGEL